MASVGHPPTPHLHPPLRGAESTITERCVRACVRAYVRERESVFVLVTAQSYGSVGCSSGDLSVSLPTLRDAAFQEATAVHLCPTNGL